MMRRALIAMAIILVITGVVASNSQILFAEASEPPNWLVGVSVGQQRGAYGGDTEIQESSAVVQVKRLFSRGSVGIATSYLSIAADSADTVNGAGDTYLRGTGILLPAAGKSLRVDGTVDVKIPTANKDDGLGTGETDYSAGFALSQFLTANTFWFAEAGYTWLGDTPDVDFNDVWYTSAGAGTYLGAHWAASAEYRYAQPSLEGNPDYKEVAFAVRWSGPLTLQAAVNFGLSDAAPDFGWSAGTFWHF